MKPIEIWGHRGARGLFPENTLAGIKAALALGIAGVEIDVALTADGVPVLSHDPRLSPDLARGPDGAWVEAPGPLIRDLTAAALGRYDVGRIRPDSETARTFPEQAAQDGARVPTLEAVLALGCRLIIELKTFPDRPEETAPPAAMAEAVARAVVAAGAENRVVVESFDWRCQHEIRRRLPGQELAWLTCAKTEADARRWWNGQAPEDFGHSVARTVAAQAGGLWAPEWPTLTEARTAEAHRLGLKVLPWTVNQPEDVARLVRWGIDGLITDRPDVAKSAALAAGARVSEAHFQPR